MTTYKQGDIIENSYGKIFKIIDVLPGKYKLLNQEGHIVLTSSTRVEATGRHVNPATGIHIPLSWKEEMYDPIPPDSQIPPELKEVDTLQPECHNEQEIDGEKAMDILRQMCGG